MIRKLLIFAITTTLLASCGWGQGKSNQSGQKVFRYNQTGGLSSLDPAFARNRASIWATSQVYNGLISMNENLDAVPELAEAYDTLNNGKTYKFIIRKGVFFHDNECFPEGKGRELVAEDFVYSFKRIIDPNVASTGAWVFNDKVLRNADGSFSDTCFVAPNDSTLLVHLQEPSPIFLQILSMPYAFVVPKEAVEKYGKDFGANPVGTGPFRLKSWDVRQDLLLVKNEKYWKKDFYGNPLPYLDAVRVAFQENPNTAFLEFQEGKLDFITSISADSREKVLTRDGQLKEEFRAKYNVDKVPYLNTEYIGFLMDNDPKNAFNKLEVRQALSYAINREGLINFIRSGLGRPGNYGFVPYGLPSFDTTMVKGYKYDPQEARRLLEKAGYPGGKGLPKLTIHSYQTDAEILEYLQKDWADVGINVEISLSMFTSHQAEVDQGKFNFFRGSWIADYPDAENFLRLFYGKKENFAPTGPNKTRYVNAQFDEMFEKAHYMNNPFERYATYRTMDSLMMHDCPVIVLYYDEVINLLQKNVRGMQINKMNVMLLEKVDILAPGEEDKEDNKQAMR
jgi:peptide/nickel transport system substrate-binding protein